jgi:hypothetical protein
MAKGYKSINMILAIALFVAVIAGCVGTKAPDSRLDIMAKAASGLIITNNGGDAVVLSNEKITVKREVNNKVVDGLNGVLLFGNSPEFQDAPVMEKLTAGQRITHTWKESLMVGDVLLITIQDTASGKMIVDTKVTVS